MSFRSHFLIGSERTFSGGYMASDITEDKMWKQIWKFSCFWKIHVFKILQKSKQVPLTILNIYILKYTVIFHKIDCWSKSIVILIKFTKKFLCNCGHSLSGKYSTSSLILMWMNRNKEAVLSLKINIRTHCFISD